MMFIYQLIGLGMVSALILRWLFNKFLAIRPTFTDIMILTLFLLSVMSLIEDLIKYEQDPNVPIMTMITSFILAIGRYRQIKQRLNQSKK